MSRFDDIIHDGFVQKRVLVIGDLVADQFLNGSISRVSREAPVFILRHEHTDTVPGGAANAASNIARLGGQAVLIGVTGEDENGQLLRQKLTENGVDVQNVISDAALKTTTKVRVLAGQDYAARQQVVRIDYENSSDLPDSAKDAINAAVAAQASGVDAIVISDYGGGVALQSVFEKAREIAEGRGIPLVVDSRYRLTEFHRATTATPNREEVEKILGRGFAVSDCEELRKRLEYRSLLVTNGNQGMLLIEEGKQPAILDAVGMKEPVDVTGAGDTVIAAYTLSLACGLSFGDAAMVANHAGGIVVMKKGTSTVTGSELTASLSRET